MHLTDGALRRVGPMVEQHHAKRILLVVDEDAAAASGAGPTLDAMLVGCEVTRFHGFQLNPQLDDIERGVGIFRQIEPQMVIALGGGTAMDLGKLIAACSSQDASPRQIASLRVPITRPSVPVMAIPTTAGTGSEATQFAVAYVDGVKHSVNHETLLPDFAIVDPTLTHSLPPRITAATGLDALCQSIESIWAVGSTDESTRLAIQAASLAIEHLVDAVCHPTPKSRMGMCQASHFAGGAINVSKTTASHALSYAFTSRHGIPHGMAVALTISQLMAYNAAVTEEDCMDPRGADHVRERIGVIVKLLDAVDVPGACRRLNQIIADIGCACSPAEAGVVDEDDLQAVAASVNVERMSNNPRSADAAALMHLLTQTQAREAIQ